MLHINIDQFQIFLSGIIIINLFIRQIMQDQKLGKRCALFECRQIDWIPIKCKYCKLQFCADHYSIATHQCKQVDKNFKKVSICPLCDIIININPILTIQQNFSVHQALDCKKIFKKKQLIICANEKCNKKLTVLNKFVCESCNSNLCLKHRFKQDHFCHANAGKMRYQKYGIKV